MKPAYINESLTITQIMRIIQRKDRENMRCYYEYRDDTFRQISTEYARLHLACTAALRNRSHPVLIKEALRRLNKVQRDLPDHMKPRSPYSTIINYFLNKFKNRDTLGEYLPMS